MINAASNYVPKIIADEEVLSEQPEIYIPEIFHNGRKFPIIDNFT
jgi:hypothetical protein